MEDLPVNPNRKFIAKSNRYISAGKDLTATQINLINVFLTKIVIKKNVDRVYFTVFEVKKLLGINVTNAKRLRETLDELDKIKISKLEDSGKIRIASLFQETNLSEDKSTIEFLLSDLAKESFIQLDKKNSYTRQLITSSIHQSTSAHVVWDILSQIKTKRDKSIIVPLDDLKNRMGLTKDSYKDFYEFRRNVLELAKVHISGRKGVDGKEDIPAKTGIQFEYEPLKQGKCVVAIKFWITSIEDYEIPPKEEEKEEVIINTDAEVAKMVESMKAEFSFTPEFISHISNDLPIKYYYAFLFDYKQKVKTKNEILHPEKALNDIFWKWKKSPKKAPVPVVVPVIPDEVLTMFAQDYSVNMPEAQNEMRKVLIKEFNFTPEKLNTLITKYDYSAFNAMLYKIRMREFNQNPYAHPSKELWMDYERVSSEKPKMYTISVEEVVSNKKIK